MSNLLDDLPARRMLNHPSTSTTFQKVYLITVPEFLQVRGQVITDVKKEFSPRVFEQLLARDPDARFVVCFDEMQEWLAHDIENWRIVHAPNASNIVCFPIITGSVEASLRLRKMLENMGVAFRPIRNSRTVSYLNIYKFVRDENQLIVVHADDYEQLGIEPDKEPTFQDLVAQRRKSAWP